MKDTENILREMVKNEMSNSPMTESNSAKDSIYDQIKQVRVSKEAARLAGQTAQIAWYDNEIRQLNKKLETISRKEREAANGYKVAVKLLKKLNIPKSKSIPGDQRGQRTQGYGWSHPSADLISFHSVTLDKFKPILDAFNKDKNIKVIGYQDPHYVSGRSVSSITLGNVI